MDHSKNYEKFKRLYNRRAINIEMLHNLVGKDLGITAEEYEEITGEQYAE